MTKAKEPSFLASENPNPVIRAGLDGSIIYANAAAEPLLHFWNKKLTDKLPATTLSALKTALNTSHIEELEEHISKHVILLRFAPFKERGYVNIYGFDITPRKRLQQRADKFENFDSVTDLPNRNYFYKQLEEDIKNAQTNNELLALLVVEINGFKTVNENLGHHVGDSVLCALSNRLSECVPEDYRIARIADNEFAVVRPHLNEINDASNLAQVITDSLSQPLLVLGYDIALSVNIGITLAPVDSTDVTSLVSNAGLAQSKAKTLGVNTFQFYKKYMSAVADAKRSLFKDLRYALERDEFVLYYQPQLRLSDQKMIGMEALIRWQHPEHGLIAPARFTGLAEERGLILPIGDWVLKSACEQTVRWHKKGYDSLTVSVNVSPVQFDEADIVERIADVLQETGLSPRKLILEITESVLISNTTAAVKKINQLHELGVQLAIDDFGTGFSSLSYLKQFSVDQLKIDKAFVAEVNQKSNKAVLIDTIIQLGHSLKMKVVAEGIENEKQLEYLLDRNCDEGQGYYFSRALSADDFGAMLKLGIQ